MKQRCLILSHESDIDGLGCIVLGKIAFGKIDYMLFPNVEKLELTFREKMENGELDKYDNIFITDLALYDPALTSVEKSSLKNKVHVFDHYKRAIDDNMNRYSFTKIIEEDEMGKRCGTQLFYEYLVQNNLINTSKSLDEFVELTRLEDTWDWKKFDKGIKAHDLAILFNAIGEDYISKMTFKLLNDSESFEFNEDESKLIQNKKDEYERTLQSIISTAEYFLDENNDKFGIVYADYEYRNELAEYIKKIGNLEKISYFIVVAMDKGKFGQKSYRTIDDAFDVNEIAMIHGGGWTPRSCISKCYRISERKGIDINEKRRFKIFSG